MKRTKLIFGLSFLVATTLVMGCGNTKRIESTEIPKSAPAAVPVPMRVSPIDHYVVANNDTLWGIAGKPNIYKDHFQWPLIFKANRDSIKDPDLIYAQQDFVIQKEVSDDEVSLAKSLAMKTPKFTPHSKPRESLPLDYF